MAKPNRTNTAQTIWGMPETIDPEGRLEIVCGKSVRVITINGVRHWSLSDLASILGYRDASVLKKCIPDEYTVKRSISTRGGKQTVRLANDDGVRWCLSKIRRAVPVELAETFNLDIISQAIETGHVELMTRCFSTYKPKPQFVCGGYRIDLYLEKAKIAIECDEHGHRYYKHREDDTKRQEAIEDILGCQFVRHDPNSPDFHIGDVISQVIRRIQESERVVRRQIA